MSEGSPNGGPSSEHWMELGRLAEVGLLVGTLVHELRQPLFAIKALLQLHPAANPDANARLLEQIQQLEAILESAGGLVRRPGDWQRPFAASEPVQAVHAAFAPRARALGVALNITLGDDLPLLRGNPVALQQVLANLVQNSLDAVRGRERPAVILEVRGAGDGVLIVVTDNGDGIDKAHRGLVFEPFFTTKPPGQGTGLGLPVARELVQMAGGTIGIESEPGRTMVSVRLPRIAPTG